MHATGCLLHTTCHRAIHSLHTLYSLSVVSTVSGIAFHTHRIVAAPLTQPWLGRLAAVPAWFLPLLGTVAAGSNHLASVHQRAVASWMVVARAHPAPPAVARHPTAPQAACPPSAYKWANVATSWEMLCGGASPLRGSSCCGPGRMDGPWSSGIRGRTLLLAGPAASGWTQTTRSCRT